MCTVAETEAFYSHDTASRESNSLYWLPIVYGLLATNYNLFNLAECVRASSRTCGNREDEGDEGRTLSANEGLFGQRQTWTSVSWECGGIRYGFGSRSAERMAPVLAWGVPNAITRRRLRAYYERTCKGKKRNLQEKKENKCEREEGGRKSSRVRRV